MSGPSAITRPVRPARPAGPVGIALALIAILVACSSSATNPPAPTQPAASPVATVSAAPATASPSAAAASASPSPALSPSAAASPTATTGTGRYGGGGATPTPAPTPKATPSPTPKSGPKPTPKPASIVVKTRSTGIGTVLVGPNGLTLYTLKSDPANGSGCTAGCAASWPPFLVKNGTTVKGGSGVSGAFSTFARSGKRQVTYKGRALYYYAGDSGAGQTNGDGAGYVWYVAKP